MMSNLIRLEAESVTDLGDDPALPYVVSDPGALTDAIAFTDAAESSDADAVLPLPRLRSSQQKRSPRTDGTMDSWI